MAVEFVPGFHGELGKMADFSINHTGAEVLMIEEDLEPHGIVARGFLVDGGNLNRCGMGGWGGAQCGFRCGYGYGRRLGSGCRLRRGGGGLFRGFIEIKR